MKRSFVRSASAASVIGGALLSIAIIKQGACAASDDEAIVAAAEEAPPPVEAAPPPIGLAEDWVGRISNTATEEELLAVLAEYAATVSVDDAQAIVEATGASDLALHTVLFRKAYLEATLGRFADAAATYGRLAEMPTEDYPATASRYYRALATYELTPDQDVLAAGDDLVALTAELEALLAAAPDDGYRRDLRYRVAIARHALGDRARFVELVTPMLASDDPDDVAFLDRAEHLRASLQALHVAALSQLGRTDEARAALDRFAAGALADADRPYLDAARLVFERGGRLPEEE